MGIVAQNMGIVYLLWGEGTMSFKIGFTREDVHYRAAIIEAYSPVRILIQGTFAGTLNDERVLHLQLHRFRSHGEWFVLPENVVWDLLAHFGALEQDERKHLTKPYTYTPAEMGQGIY